LRNAPSPQHGTLTWLAQAGDALASFFLPANCRLCETPLIHASRLPICANCLDSFVRIGDLFCHGCGLPFGSPPSEKPTQHELESQPEPLCGACRLGTYRFARARSVFRYQDALVRAIVMLKFEEIEPLADWFTVQLAKLARESGLAETHVVVPVPLHKARQRERGFNQAELLSKRLAKRLKLRHEGVLLVRKRPRPDKHLLTERERWDAVGGAFAARSGSQVDNQRVLLVDDVMTTGATLDACAKALRDAGAGAVNCLTIARAIVRYPQKPGLDSGQRYAR